MSDIASRVDNLWKNFRLRHEGRRDSLREVISPARTAIFRRLSIGPKQALSFLPPDHPLRERLLSSMATMPVQELRVYNQGYLLVSIGTKQEDTRE